MHEVLAFEFKEYLKCLKRPVDDRSDCTTDCSVVHSTCSLVAFDSDACSLIAYNFDARSLIASDFDRLPDIRIPGRNAPLVAEKVSGLTLLMVKGLRIVIKMFITSSP